MQSVVLNGEFDEEQCICSGLNFEITDFIFGTDAKSYPARIPGEKKKAPTQAIRQTNTLESLYDKPNPLGFRCYREPEDI